MTGYQCWLYGYVRVCGSSWGWSLNGSEALHRAWLCRRHEAALGPSLGVLPLRHEEGPEEPGSQVAGTWLCPVGKSWAHSRLIPGHPGRLSLGRGHVAPSTCQVRQTQDLSRSCRGEGKQGGRGEKGKEGINPRTPPRGLGGRSGLQSPGETQGRCRRGNSGLGQVNGHPTSRMGTPGSCDCVEGPWATTHICRPGPVGAGCSSGIIMNKSRASPHGAAGCWGGWGVASAGKRGAQGCGHQRKHGTPPREV